MNLRTRHLKFERTLGITYINHHFFYFLNFWQPVGLKKGKKSQSLKLQTQLIFNFNGQFFCVKKAQHTSITGRTGAKFVSPFMLSFFPWKTEWWANENKTLSWSLYLLHDVWFLYFIKNSLLQVCLLLSELPLMERTFCSFHATKLFLKIAFKTTINRWRNKRYIVFIHSYSLLWQKD